MITIKYPKDPDATLDYGFDWSPWLEKDETVATSEWILSDGLTKESDQKTSTNTRVWITGGEDGRSYQVTNRITTSMGRTDDRTLLIRVQSR